MSFWHHAAYVLASTALATSLHAAEALRLVGDEFCPYNCDPDTGQPGYMVGVLGQIFAAQGMAVDYQLRPWSRAIRMVAESDAEILLASTYDSAPDPQLQVVLGEDSTCFVTRHNSRWTYQGTDSLQQQRLGTIQGYYYDSDGPLDQFLNSQGSLVHRAKGESALGSLLSMLDHGRLDVVLENCNVVKRKIQVMGLSGLTRISGTLPGYNAKLYVSFSPADPDAANLQRTVEEGVAAMRQSGKLATILQRYAVDDWQRATPAVTP